MLSGSTQKLPTLFSKNC